MPEQDSQAKDQDLLPVEGEAFAKRRQVIKGLASAVPVIMTVSSGSAMANASSMQCLDVAMVDLPEDCVATADKDAVVEDQVITDDDWYRRVTKSRKKACIIKYVDQNGTLMESLDGTGHPLSTSCANSFNFI